MITLLIVGPVRLITHRGSLFPLPASPDGAAQRAGGTPTQRIASPSAFASAWPLSLRFRCLARLSKLKGRYRPDSRTTGNRGQMPSRLS